MVDKAYLEYIQAKVAAGVSVDDIKRVLRGNGVSEEDITEALASAGVKAAPAPATPPPAVHAPVDRVSAVHSPSINPIASIHAAAKEPIWSRALRVVIVIYELAFGLIGLFMLVKTMLPTLQTIAKDTSLLAQQNVIMYLVLNAAAVLFCILSVVAGILLLRGRGRAISLVLALMQVPTFIVNGAQYLVSLGVGLMVTVPLPIPPLLLHVSILLGPQFTVSFNPAVTIAVGINFGAIILFVLLLALRTVRRGA